jgi:CspA family cold shock protein
MKGKVRWYDIKKGFGFIEGEDGQDVFIHKSEVPFWTIYLSKNDKVEYIKENTNKGIKATEVKIL